MSTVKTSLPGGESIIVNQDPALGPGSPFPSTAGSNPSDNPNVDPSGQYGNADRLSGAPAGAVSKVLNLTAPGAIGTPVQIRFSNPS